MRKILLLLFVSAVVSAQEVSLTMESGYANEVYYKFSDGSNSSYDRENWDIAFLRISNYTMGVRLNQGKGLNVYEASTDLDAWDTLDLSAAEGTALHNSPSNWGVGAFDNGSATYGWGEYNPTTHHVSGSVIFLIENAASSTYYKFMIEDYFGGYTVKYALWDAGASAWGADQTTTVSNTTNEGHLFNFLNLNSGEVVDASPALTEWDLVFKRYSEDLGGGTMYTVTGTLHNPNVTVAQVEEATNATPADTETLTYAEEINTIGYDWKALNASWSYDIVADRVYYVKSNDLVYRVYFTSFEGSSTGNLSFNSELLTMSTVDVAGEVKFAVYPNPVKDNQITLVYDNANTQTDKAVVEIYNLAGQQVFSTQLNNAGGLFQRTISLNHLSKGAYILRYVQGNDVKTEKLLIQ